LGARIVKSWAPVFGSMRPERRISAPNLACSSGDEISESAVPDRL
jgi:hypothetical protein